MKKEGENKGRENTNLGNYYEKGKEIGEAVR